jgi:hypothetical protein
MSTASLSDTLPGRRVGGEYVHDASIVEIKVSAQERKAAMDVMLECERRGGGCHKAPGLSDIAPMLSEVHELDHYRLLQSTPFGLLSWRLWQCLSVNLSFIERQIAAVCPHVLADEQDLLFDAAPAAFPAMAASADRDYFANVVEETRLYQQLLDWLNDGREVSVGLFVASANAVFDVLAIRSEVPHDGLPRWTTRLPLDAPLLAEGAMTAVELLEAGARARELMLLNDLDVGDDAVAAWRDARIFGVYAAAFPNLMSQLGEPNWIRVVLDIAFSADMDITAAGPELCVEDVLPSLRVPRLVKALRSQILHNDLDRFRSLVGRDLAEAAGLMAPCDTFARLAQVERLFGEAANFGGRVSFREVGGADLSKDFEANSVARTLLGSRAYFEVTHARFREAFKERESDPIRYLRSDRTRPIAPLISYFMDNCVFNLRSAGEDPGLTFLHTHANMISRRMAQYVAFGAPLTNLREQHAAFLKGFATLVKDDAELLDILKGFFSPESLIFERFSSERFHRRLARAIGYRSIEEAQAQRDAALRRIFDRQPSSDAS